MGHRDRRHRWHRLRGGTAFRDRRANLFVVGKEAGGVEVARGKLAEAGTEVRAACLDLSRRAALDELVGLARALPRVDVLVNNVGIIGFTPIERVTHEEFDAFVDVSLRTCYFFVQALVAQLERSKGNVVNMSSYFATKILPDRRSSLYSMIKGAMSSLTRAQAFELGARGIRVNAIAPGTVDSPGRTAQIEVMEPGARRRLEEYNARAYPLGRIGQPDDVAKAILFLASDAADWITGSVLAVDGGLTAG